MEWSAGETLQSEDYSIGVDRLNRADKYTMSELAHGDDGLEIIELPRNVGKGAALLHGLQEAAQRGYSHALTMDSDGQHPAWLIPSFMATSRAHPDALILGDPIFDRSAPLVRVLGRKLSNVWTSVETLWVGRFDSLFGFRVYPVGSLREIMEESRWMRRFDFDAEAAVRLCWRGYRPLSVPAPVRYFTPQQGGVSHFRYLRDNVLLSWMHARLVVGCVRRLPRLLARRVRSSRH